MQPWMANVRNVEPYVPGEQPKGEKLIKLNTNENPYPPAPGVADTLATMEADAFRKYPDPSSSGLIKALSDYHGLPCSQIFVGVGSDEVLAMSFMAFFNSPNPIVFPDITYSFYPVWAELFQTPYKTSKLNEQFGIVKEDFYEKNGGVIFPNPNAPTGVLMSLEDVEDVVAHNQDVVVIVDEAYIDFGGISAKPLLERYDNLLIVQTFSKSRSMAGMRIGYALGSPELIRILSDVKYSFNSYTMNLPSQILGVVALKDKAYFNRTTAKIIETRENAKKRLAEMGFSFPDSMANFIFARHSSKKACDLYEFLKKNQIYVRYFPQPRLDNYLRISIGDEEEMEILYQTLEGYLSEKR